MTRHSQAGQAVFLVAAVLCLVLMGFAGLAVDMGYLRYQRRLEQTAADNAALMGASDLVYGSSAAVSAACNTAATNGFADNTGAAQCSAVGTTCTANSVGCVTITVNNPPASGVHTGTAYLEVIVSKIQPTFFMKIFGVSQETVTARAVGYDSGNSAGCLYTLGPSTDGITMNGNDTINAPNCGIVDDGDLTIHGTAAQLTATSIAYVGTYSASGHPTVTPTPVQTVHAGDPLAYLTTPPIGSTCQPNPNLSGSGTFTLNQGNYCNGITISTTGNRTMTVTMNAGVYEITGGNFSVDAKGSSTINLNGSGVMIYNNAGSDSITGGVIANLSAPTANNSGTGAAAGILFWQDKSDTNSPTFSPDITSTMSGAFYFPTADVTMSGSGASAAYTFLVVKGLTKNGNNTLTLNSNVSSLPGGSPIKNAVLVE